MRGELPATVRQALHFDHGAHGLWLRSLVDPGQTSWNKCKTIPTMSQVSKKRVILMKRTFQNKIMLADGNPRWASSS